MGYAEFPKNTSISIRLWLNNEDRDGFSPLFNFTRQKKEPGPGARG